MPRTATLRTATLRAATPRAHRVQRAPFALIGLCGLLAACGSTASAAKDSATTAAEPVDLAALAASWTESYRVTGIKTEPTYVEHVTITRDNDVFTVAGGAMVHMEPSIESVRLADDGSVEHLVCPAAMDCSTPRPLTGFLATASVLSAARTGRLTGTVFPQAFGDRTVVCVPAEQIGVDDPVLDPCLDIETGAVLAQRHRRSGTYDGPTFDPWSVTVTAVSDTN